MRKLLLLTICLVMAIASRAQLPPRTRSYHFTTVHDGITYYCNIKDETNRKILLVRNSNPSNLTVQTLIVPEKLTAPSGIEYTVTHLGENFTQSFENLEEVIFPKTLEYMEWGAAVGHEKLKKITVQSLKTYDGVVIGSMGTNALLEEVRLLMTTLPNNVSVSGYPSYQFAPNYLNRIRVIVPVDYAILYRTSPIWKRNGKSPSPVQYYEELKIGPNGYTSYYLENENFEVPTGSTAYIIKGAINRLNYTGDAVVEAFPAGSIIPKQTGFILSGTAGSTVAYRACVDGPEVDVTGNLLVGTATEQEFSGTGYRYYIFGNGSEGQGFYHQGTRKGNSMKVGAHRAGLKLPITGYAPAKPFVFNFEEAVRNTVTGISTVKTESAAKDAPIYNLQGCRVTNPTNGIYIVNGKKVLIKK